MEIDEGRLVALIRTTVECSIKTGIEAHICRYDYDPNEIDHIMGMVSDIGDGDRRRGIETLRVIHLWTMKRISKDEAYEANHRLITTFREAGGSVVFKLAQVFVWACMVVTVGTALALFGNKIAPLLGK